MKKLAMLLSILLVVSGLAACGGSKEVSEKEVKNVESSEKEDKKEEEEKEKKDSELKEINQEIVNNENLKATLVSVEKVEDKDWDEEKILVKFEVENNRQETIAVQAKEVSADGKMIDESMLTMSQEVSPGKKADAVLTIQNYDGDLPTIEQDIEMILHVFSFDNMDYSEDHNVKVEFK